MKRSPGAASSFSMPRATASIQRGAKAPRRHKAAFGTGGPGRYGRSAKVQAYVEAGGARIARGADKVDGLSVGPGQVPRSDRGAKDGDRADDPHPRTGHGSAFPPNYPRLRRYVTSRLSSNPGSEWHLSAASAMLDMPPQERPMPRFRAFVPHGGIPAALLPFDADLAIDEAAIPRPLRETS